MSNTAVTILGMCLIFVMTTLGASVVYFFRNDISPKLNAVFLGFASGIMVAASVWSLLIPAMEEADFGAWNWVPAAVGFIVGGLFLVLLDKIVPHLHKGTNEEEGPRVALKKPVKLFLAVTIHNIPEGLAVGFAFGAAALGENAAYISALGLAIGIAVQNFPEGAAVALPMRAATGSRNKAFFYGLASGAAVRGGGIFSRKLHHGIAAMAFIFCRGRDDLRGGGRPDSRRPPFRISAFGHMGTDDRICAHDDFGCGVGLTCVAVFEHKKKNTGNLPCFSVLKRCRRESFGKIEINLLVSR